MRVRALLSIVSLLAGSCAGPSMVSAPQVPLRTDAGTEASSWREERVLAAADRSPPVARPPAGTLTVTAPTYRTVIHVVEQPVYIAPPAENEARWDEGVWDEGEWDAARRYERVDVPPRPWFPVHTALGAGIGAIIGHQSGDRAEGAWIGGSLGLLLDLGRWR